MEEDPGRAFHLEIHCAIPGYLILLVNLAAGWKETREQFRDQIFNLIFSIASIILLLLLLNKTSGKLMNSSPRFYHAHPASSMKKNLDLQTLTLLLLTVCVSDPHNCRTTTSCQVTLFNTPRCCSTYAQTHLQVEITLNKTLPFHFFKAFVTNVIFHHDSAKQRGEGTSHTRPLLTLSSPPEFTGACKR